MEILKDKYYSFEPELLKELSKCEFLSFSLTYTGKLNGKSNMLENLTEKYNKMKQNAERYKIIQVIICFFFKKDDKNYEAHPYSFYLFPSEKANNFKLDCTIPSIIYNKKNGCDFNKWIHQGIPYVNNDLSMKLRDRLLNQNINKYNPDDSRQYKKITFYNKIHKSIYDNFLKEFNKFYKDDKRQILKTQKMMRHLIIHFLNEIPKSTRDNIYIEYDDNNNEMLFQKLSGLNEKETRIAKDNLNSQKEIKIERGFKSFFDEILKSKKPIIGYNCFLYILFFYTHFISELPLEYKEFKYKYIDIFKGKVYDVKNLFINLKDLAINIKKKSDLNPENILEKLKEYCGNELNIYIKEEIRENENELNGISEITSKLSDISISQPSKNLYQKAFEIGSIFLYIKEYKKKEEDFLFEKANQFCCDDLFLYNTFNIGGRDTFSDDIENAYKINVKPSTKLEECSREEEIDKIFNILNEEKYNIKLYEKREKDIYEIYLLTELNMEEIKKLLNTVNLELEIKSLKNI